MKIACFYPRSIASAWSISEGLVEGLRRIGHKTLSCPFDPLATVVSRADYPSRDQLDSCAAIFVSGPEHIFKFLHALYPDWKHMQVPKIALLHESVQREDYKMLDVALLKSCADTIFCPAFQDSAYGLNYMPFPVDTCMFHPTHGEAQTARRTHGAVFIGTPYGKRRDYYERHRLADLVKCANVKAIDLDGINVRASSRLLADAYRSIRLLVNLPTLSRLLVTKIGEAMACETCVLTPRLPHDAADNMREFVGGQDLVYYDPDDDDLADVIRHYLANDNEREQIARNGCKLIHSKHSLDNRLGEMLAVAGVGGATQAG